ncbi:MAG: septum formation initiator family protein [Pseudomonadota bacterium]|nr:septum formation initiator family protein [Pseudomonadota bacterium]
MSIRAIIHNVRSRKPVQGIWSVLGVCLVVYFTYHAIQGPRGLIVYSRLRNEAGQAEELLASLHARRTDLEQQTRHLRPSSLSPDMLEERARVLLNWSHPHDLIILDPVSQP